ncbi:hypothetical protein [Jeotgalibacillus proteolyticus]|uniref:Uncharacterized protein n=1 Tax=Jeotgalibacillus proteolyticus TaxID=2082395 RepID=A0A2S5G843_9BACL|nr:hypothetical protein [Jeotgalibacillus proteolyticus]PPA69113.1 hypothetical protein C4B60_17535 [Jeotgalibacillus proteolyticus]
MAIISALSLIFLIPFLWVGFSLIDVTRGKRDKIAWKKPLILFAAILVISAIINYHFYSTYQLPLFLNETESIVALVIAGAFLVFLSILNIVVTLMNKGAPKSLHNPKAVWVFIICFTLFSLFISFWVLPFAQKSTYVADIKEAMQALSDEEANEEVSVAIVRSTKECIRRVTANCTSTDYSNYFYVKNNLDDEKEVQLRIRALDANENEIKVAESNIMTLGPGEVKLVETEETSDEDSILSRYSFTTEQRIFYYESMFRFRDVQ